MGSMADLWAASLADVSAFFSMYYAPNNASLVIAGDIDVPKTKELVAKYFGPIPRGPEVAKPKPEVPKLDGPKHVTMNDRVTLPLARLVGPTAPVGPPPEPPLDLLTDGPGQLRKGNRLYP